MPNESEARADIALKRPAPEVSHALAAVGAVLIWSVSFVATKVAYGTLPPLTLGALRFAFAAAVLGLFLLLRGRSVRLAPGDLPRMLLGGFLGITAYFSLENLGVKLSTAADAALIVASYPAITMLLEILLYRASVSWVRLGGVGVTMGGVYLVARAGSQTGGPHRLAGDLILAAAGIVWSCYNFVTRKVVNRYPPAVVTFWQAAAGAVAFLPLAFMERGQWRLPSPAALAALLYLGLFCSVLAFILYAYGLRRLAPSAAVTLMNLVPVFGVLFAALFLQETLSAAQVAGGLIVLAGIVVSVRGRKNESGGGA